MQFLRNIKNILSSASNEVDVPVESVKFPFVKSTAFAIELKGLSTNISLYNNATTDAKLRMITKITILLQMHLMQFLRQKWVAHAEIH